MKQFSLLIILFVALHAKAQLNYTSTNSRTTLGTYTDITAAGTTIPMTDVQNGSSTTPQNIGFNFTFNGIVFTQVMIHADGILKFGTTAPGISTFIASNPSTSYAGVFTTTNAAYQNIVMPLFLDLVQGTATPQFHLLTTGTAPNRITTIQWKNLRDADNTSSSTLEHQFNNMEFQVKLYETTNNIEFCYGQWLASTNALNVRGSAIGIKANNTNFLTFNKPAGLGFNNASLEDNFSANSKVFILGKVVSPIIGTTLTFYVRITNDINVAKLYVDDAVPQSPTIGKNIQALIKNEGSSAATNIPVTLTVTGANSITEIINVASLAAGAAQIVTFTPFIAAAKGLQTVSISVSPSLDNRIENNNLQTNQTVSHSMVKTFSNDKKSREGVGFNGISRMFATKIFGTGTRNLSQIRASFVTSNVLVDVRIYEDNGAGEIPDAVPLFISPQFRTNAENEVIIPITTAVTVTGNYYIVLAQRETSNMGLHFFRQYPGLPQKAYNATLDGNNWVAESNTSFNAILAAFQETNTVDVGFEQITSPQCGQTNNEQVKATIKNFSNQIHDYAANPVTISGSAKDEVNNVTIPFSFTKNSGTIAAGGRDTILLLNNYNFTAKGNFLFNAKTNCAADVEPFNDSLHFSILTKIVISGAPADSICPNTSVVLSIVSQNLRSPLAFTAASDGSNVTGGTTITVAPNTTTTYYASGLDYRGCTITDSVIVKVKTIGVPVAPIVMAIDSILSFRNDYNVVFTITPLAGHTISWGSTGTAGVVSNGGTTYTVAATNAIGFTSTHKAFYIRISDGCSGFSSNAITTTFAPGLLISSLNNNVCDTSFYDDGGFAADYTGVNYTKTYTPTDASKKLRLTINKYKLTQFGTITVYDGPDISSPEIGNLQNSSPLAAKYEFVASNPGGVLTVRFIANGTENGFIGGLVCQTPLQFRSIANGVFSNNIIWESRPIGTGTFSPATRFPNKGDDTVWIRHNVNINSTIALDQIVVDVAGFLEVTGSNTSLDLFKTISDNELTIKGTFKTNPNTFVGRNSTNVLLLGTLINTTDMQTDSVKVFENATSAVISGNGTIGKLIMNSSQPLLVNGNVRIRNELSLINGIMQVNPANFISLIAGNSPVINGGSINSYVAGRLRREVFSTSDSISFPLGANGLYRPVILLANQNSFDNAVEYEAVMKFGAATSRTLPATLASVNGRYFHNITITNNPGNFTDATVTIHYSNGDGIADAANLRIAKDGGGTNWIDIGGVGTANNVGSITSNTFTGFSDFVLANSTAGLNVLPLRLLNFTGTQYPNYNSLNWKTENERNTAYFIVEKSIDGMRFSSIGNVTAVGNGANKYYFKDINPSTSVPPVGLVYYRLKMIDLDGKFTYSVVIKIAHRYTTKLHIYPNPATEKVVIDYKGMGNNVTVRIYDSKAARVKSTAIYTGGQIIINVSQLSKGLYFVELFNGNKTEKGSFIKE